MNTEAVFGAEYVFGVLATLHLLAGVGFIVATIIEYKHFQSHANTDKCWHSIICVCEYAPIGFVTVIGLVDVIVSFWCLCRLVLVQRLECWQNSENWNRFWNIGFLIYGLPSLSVPVAVFVTMTHFAYSYSDESEYVVQSRLGILIVSYVH